MLIGMKRWYEKVQKPINKMTILDLEIREIEKNKVSAELAKIKLEAVKIEKELEEMNSKKHMPFKTRKEL
jgi:FtsZ-binding cell division protein ZapB